MANRTELTPLRVVAKGRQIEERERDAALARQYEARVRAGKMSAARRRTGGKFAPASEGDEPAVKSRSRAGHLNVIVATEIGVSTTHYERAKRVALAAEQNPDAYGHIAKAMDAGTLSINEAARQVSGLPRPPKPPPMVAPKKFNANKAIESISMGLEGMRSAVDNADLDTIDPVIAAKWIDSYLSNLAHLRKFGKEIKNAADRV